MRKFNQMLRQEEGVSALYMAMILFLLVGILGIALDGSNAYIQRRRMQNAADFAALAGARVLALGGNTAAIDTEVDSLAIANGVGNPSAGSDGLGNGIEIAGAAASKIAWQYTNDDRGIEVELVNHYDPFFARIFGYEILTSTAKASAGYLPVVGVNNLLPLAINGCDCVNFDELPASLAQSDFASTVLAVYTIGNINDNSINYTFYLKNVDPTYPGNTANRPYYLFYEPNGEGTLTVFGDGTAHGVAQVINVNGDGFAVDLRFSGRTSVAPDGQSPACDGACPTTTDWHYYPTVTGTLTGLPGTRYAGAVIRVTRRGAAVQVGTNAHLKNPKPEYGSAAWLALEVLQQPSTGVTLNSTNQEAILNMLLLPSGEAPQTTPTSVPAASCPLYPIALSAQTLNGATLGTTLGDIWNGAQPGNFGWLTWAGAPNVPTLVLSLTPPGNSQTYINPNQPTDTVVSIGDWVQGSPGVSNASNVRAALDVLKTINITVPVWDQASGTGNNSLYRVANFAVVRITDYQLPNQNRITATFVGYATDCGGSAPPTVTPTPSPSPTLTLPPAPSATATPAATDTTACLVSYRVTSDWGTGFTADVTITNQTGAKLKDWLLTWTFAGNQQITNLWNGVLTQTGNSVRVANASWNGNVNKASTVAFGFQASYSAQNMTPTNFTLNGLSCNGGAVATATPSPTTPAATPSTATPSPSPTPSLTVLPPTPLSTTVSTPTPTAPTGSCALDDTTAALNRYTLIVLDDLSTSSDIENRAFVGGNLVSTASANIGINVQGIAASEPMFSVVGNLVAGNPINLNAGSLHLGGNRNGRPINFNGGGTLVQDPTLFDTAITNLLQTATAQLAAEPANNGVSLPTGQPGPARFQVTATTAEGVAIFQVAAADLFGNNLVQQMELTPGAATTILINVTGSNVDWNGNGNMVGNFTNSQWRGRVLWNFAQATAINFRAHNFMGALLAPYAQVTTAANLDGAVAVRALTTSAEVHQPTFNGALGALCETAIADPPATTPCQLAWLDWDGGLASTGELADAIRDPSQSGQHLIGEWVVAGPTVTYDQQVANALAQWLNIPALVVFYNEGDQHNGYQICGFAEFTLTDYDLAALPPWLQGTFSPALVRGLTDPNATDYGLRDLRFK